MYCIPGNLLRVDDELMTYFPDYHLAVRDHSVAFLRGMVIPLWKWKREYRECSNYRAMTLLRIPGMLLTHLL